MTGAEEFSKYTLKTLDKKTAEKYSNDIAVLVGEIPLVKYTPEEIVAESKDDRVFYGKWDHSLILLDEDKPIAVVVSYERKSEGSSQYPNNTLYISELAVDRSYQKKGMAKNILNSFFQLNNKLGFKYLDGDLNYSVQTNIAEWNKHVQRLYESFGFKQRSTKQYDNRTDVVLGMKPEA